MSMRFYKNFARPFPARLARSTQSVCVLSVGDLLRRLAPRLRVPGPGEKDQADDEQQPPPLDYVSRAEAHEHDGSNERGQAHDYRKTDHAPRRVYPAP